jgi:DNA-binding GntR family transcriptional regulator
LAYEGLVALQPNRSATVSFELNEAIRERFHLGAGNHTLTLMLRSISSHIQRARLYANIVEERWAGAVRKHEGIITTLEARDSPLLAKLLRVHVENTFEGIKQTLSSRSPD